MTENIIVRGFVATYPTLKRLPNGTPVSNFRLASTPRWFDQATQSWKEGQTNWFTINAFRQLAHNSSRSLQIGHPVFVSGKLKVRTWDKEDGSTGQSVEIDAQFMGHDLSLGTSGFQRNVSPQAPSAELDNGGQLQQGFAPQQQTNPPQQQTDHYQQQAQQNPVQWGSEQGSLSQSAEPTQGSQEISASDPVAEHEATYDYDKYDFVEETSDEKEPALA